MELISTTMIEIVKIYERLHENAIVIFITNKYLKKTENNYVTEYDYGDIFEF